MSEEAKVQLWSKTAKDWFKNEDFVVAVFNNWKNDNLAQEWLKAMWYKIEEIESVHASKVPWSFKADVQVRIEIKLKELDDIQNLQVKLVSNPSWFNQIDKRWIEKYKELRNIPENVEKLLKHFSWELKPYINNPQDRRRMFANEFTESEQKIMLDFLRENKTLIVSDILKWRWKFAAERILVILKLKWQELKWTLKPINVALNYYWNWDVEITPRWSFKIWNITLQRKWGDWWRETANMLQFKINPCELFNL